MQYNSTHVAGNLTRDVELKYTASGTEVCTLCLAVNRKYKDQEEVLFIDVTVWGKVAENCDKYLSKGSSVFVEGFLYQQTWEKDGQKQSKIKINAQNVQFLTFKNDKPAFNSPEPKEPVPPPADLPY